MRTFLLAMAVLVAGCDLRQVPVALHTLPTCIGIQPATRKPLAIQVLDAAQEGVDDIPVRWSVAPESEQLRLEDAAPSSATKEWNGIRASGIVDAMLVAGDNPPPAADVRVSTSDNSFVDVRIRVFRAEGDSDPCAATEQGGAQ